jgi:hypothetical protein
MDQTFLDILGNYHLKAELKRAFIPPSDIILPKRVVCPDEVIEYLKNEKPLHQVEKLIHALRLTAISIKNRKIYYRCLINRVVTFFFNYCFIVFDIYRRYFSVDRCFFNNFLFIV